VSDGQAFVLLAATVVIGFFVVAIPVVLLLNRAIGRTYDELAQSLEPYWQAEGVRFREDAVRTRGTWLAPLAVAVRWTLTDVRVTSRGIYLVQSTRMFGMRIGQPILAIAQPGATLDPGIAGRVKVAWLKTYPRLDKDVVLLEGGLGVQRFTLRLELAGLGAFLTATRG
jgi:hypothetical protein